MLVVNVSQNSLYRVIDHMRYVLRKDYDIGVEAFERCLEARLDCARFGVGVDFSRTRGVGHIPCNYAHL